MRRGPAPNGDQPSTEVQAATKLPDEPSLILLGGGALDDIAHHVDGAYMSIVGVDLSLASTGVALADGPVVETFRITSKGTKTDTVAVWAQRIIDITSRILEHIPMDVALVVLEAPSLGQARQAGEHLRSGLWWRLAAALYLRGHPIAEVPPANLERYAVGRGNAAKDEVLASVVRRYPDVNVTGNDIADALVLAAMGARRLGFPTEESLPQANLVAMTKINWPEAGRDG